MAHNFQEPLNSPDLPAELISVPMLFFGRINTVDERAVHMDPITRPRDSRGDRDGLWHIIPNHQAANYGAATDSGPPGPIVSAPCPRVHLKRTRGPDFARQNSRSIAARLEDFDLGCDGLERASLA